jgi:hypothetical protein
VKVMQIAGQALSKIRELLRSPPRERLLLTIASHACIARRRIMFERSIEVRKVACDCEKPSCECGNGHNAQIADGWYRNHGA